EQLDHVQRLIALCDQRSLYINRENPTEKDLEKAYALEKEYARLHKEEKRLEEELERVDNIEVDPEELDL
ncbi:MAG: hypothetical protein ACI4LH_08880, partial [Candidatus Heritagella sp.]